MKKIKQSTYTDLPTAKIFFDDLEEIDKILKESCSSYTLTLDEYELDSINEIAEIKEKQDFHNLEIRLDEPRLSLIMEEDSSYIISKEDSLCVGIIERIKPIIQKRRKNIYFQWPYIFIFLLIFIVLLDKTINLYSDFIEDIILGTIFILSIFIISPFFKNDRNKFTVFTTKKSNEPTNYFITNKNQILSNSISAAIGAIFATLLRFILDKYTP